MNQQQLECQRDLYLLLLDAKNDDKDTNEVLSIALKLVVEITGARIGYIELRNMEGKTWWSKAHCDENEVNTIRRRIATGIISEAIFSGKTIVTPSAFIDSRFSERDSVFEGRIEAVLCSPFESDCIKGVVYLQGDGEYCFENEHCMMETEIFKRHITPLLRRLYQKAHCDCGKIDLRKRYDLSDIIGESTVLYRKLEEAMAIAELDVTILLTGETGTGKGTIAKAIHNNSFRKTKPFVQVNCANLPEQLAESELFGALKGAHSGAYTDMKGKVASAKGGTLFLDEIGALPATVQAKLLQFLEDGSFCPLGSTITQNADVRIIAATNIDFCDAISKGIFKEDLYYRLCVFPIELPPIRNRKDDIPELITYFINKYCLNYKMPVLNIDSRVLYELQEYEWNGNVREIENKVQQAILRARVDHSSELLYHHFLPDQKMDVFIAETLTYRQGKDCWERKFINEKLNKNCWNISETAKLLDLSRSHLNNLIKIHHLCRKNNAEV